MGEDGGGSGDREGDEGPSLCLWQTDTALELAWTSSNIPSVWGCGGS